MLVWHAEEQLRQFGSQRHHGLQGCAPRREGRLPGPEAGLTRLCHPGVMTSYMPKRTQCIEKPWQ